MREFAALRVREVLCGLLLLGVAASALAGQDRPVGRRDSAAANAPTSTPDSLTPLALRERRDSVAMRTQVDRVVRVLIDNDLFALRDSGAATDFDYTHGMGVELYWANAPQWMRNSFGGRAGCEHAIARANGCQMFSLAVRQAIYTPASNRSVPVPGQRPHAGYLGVSARLSHATPTRTRTGHVELGTTGKLAMAEPLQKLIHALTGTARELGWRNQIGTRPTLLLRYDESYVRDMRAGPAFVRVKPNWLLQVGNLRTSASVGADLQLSMNRPLFWIPHDGGAALPLGPYLLAGVRQDRVARDVFVDGHFGDHSVTSVREPNVSQTMLGFGWRFPGGTSEYRYIRRGKEYDAQTAVHSHGAFAFTFYRQ